MSCTYLTFITDLQQFYHHVQLFMCDCASILMIILIFNTFWCQFKFDQNMSLLLYRILRLSRVNILGKWLWSLLTELFLFYLFLQNADSETAIISRQHTIIAHIYIFKAILWNPEYRQEILVYNKELFNTWEHFSF